MRNPEKEVSKPSPGPKLESLVRSATPPARINIANGFKIDLLYSVPMEKQGSWVAMCMDDKQRLIVSDQYGGIYRFPIPKPGKNADPASIEQITYATERPGMGKPTEAQKKLPQIGHAQGLCYAFDSLSRWWSIHVSTSTIGQGSSVCSTTSDDQFDKIVTVKKLSATGGEHGPHAILPAPDGKHSYAVMGNQTQLPEDYTHSRVPELWAEDQLFPSLQYFMKGAEAPLGHIAQIDPEGKTWESHGHGIPQPVRRRGQSRRRTYLRRGHGVGHEHAVVPPYPGQPRDRRFRVRLAHRFRQVHGLLQRHLRSSGRRRARFADWSMFRLRSKVSRQVPECLFHQRLVLWQSSMPFILLPRISYVGKVEEFASAQPLPLTDLLVNPEGRGHVRCGGRPQGAVRALPGDLRREGIHCPGQVRSWWRGGEEASKGPRAFLQKGVQAASPKQLNQIWSAWALKIGASAMPPAWPSRSNQSTSGRKRIAAEKNPVIATAALIALARVDGKSSSDPLTKAMTFDYRNEKNWQQRIDLFRSITLALTRGGQPKAELKKSLIAWLDQIYPASSPEENRDLCPIMQLLQAPSAV